MIYIAIHQFNTVPNLLKYTGPMDLSQYFVKDYRMKRKTMNQKKEIQEQKKSTMISRNQSALITTKLKRTLIR